MLKTLVVRNFKSIKQKEFSIKNLNVLLGLNGVGKSSLIQVLLALKQSQGLMKGRLDLNGWYVKLGVTKDILYQYSTEKFIELSLSGDTINLNFCFNYEKEIDYFLDQSITRNKTTLYENYLKSENLFSDNFQYLSANRIGPLSVHFKNYGDIDNRSLGSNGESVVHFIDSYSNEEVHFDNLLHPLSSSIDQTTNRIILNKTLINQINLWLGEVSPNVRVRTTSISSSNLLLGFEYKQANFGTTNQFKPENVGFGISYSLPVVVALLSARPGQLIIIENPESHVHPRGQAELGKLIAKVAQNDVQIIVETHSDHILNGIRVAVKEAELERDRVKIFYFEKVYEPDEQYSKVTDIEIDKNGELSEYPVNMLDEWNNQLLKLI
jgi:predicted ATPase